MIGNQQLILYEYKKNIAVATATLKRKETKGCLTNDHSRYLMIIAGLPPTIA
jgi:hypothetical protein